jgi:excisionase family DNA binding protein
MVTLEQYLRSLVREEAREAMREVLAARAAGVDELVTIAAFARARSISPSTVRKALRDGRLDATRIGRSIRIHAGASIRPRSAARADADAAMASAARRLGVVR